MKQRQFASFSSFSPIVSQRWPEMAPVGTDPAQFLDSGGESRLVTSFASLGPGWHGIGGMTEDYAKIGTALARGELAREPVPISTEESTSAKKERLWLINIYDTPAYKTFSDWVPVCGDRHICIFFK